MSDSVDAGCFLPPSNAAEDCVVTQPEEITTDDTVEEDLLHYKMTHPRRGTAVIFNHYEFTCGLQKRDGTEKDKHKLRSVLEDLKFDVVVHEDLTLAEVFDEIDSLSQADHSDADCLLVVVLSHGDPGMIWAQDHEYSTDKLFKSFAGDKCLGLAGKPKLFFIQACRGNNFDDGVNIPNIECDTGSIRRSGGKPCKIPTMADILVMHSTYDGYYSFRDTENGSWFIQSLCSELKKHAGSKDLLTILTSVNYTVAVHYQSRLKALCNKKQISTIVSTLTRQICFYHTDK